jgi:hypothetical protein
MSKTYNSKYSKKLTQALLSQWACPVAFDARYIDIVKGMCDDISSELSNNMLSCINNNDFDGLLKLSCDPNDYSNHEDYIKDNLLVGFVKKYPHWATSIDPKVEAMKTFILAEIECDRTNVRISCSRRNFTEGVVPNVILTAARKIQDILGNVPSISSLPLEFGKGASFSVKGKTSSYDHITGALDVTSKAADAAVTLLASTPGWLSLHGIDPSDTARIRDCITVIPGSRLAFVPKTAKTDRPINIEPGLNKVLQKGFGTVIRRRMKRKGIHLNRNPEKHQILARKGSIDGSLATIDLSSASDTISYEIVKELLPYQWFDALNDLRCEQYSIENNWYDFQKFSAMGNGYTFELESLLFYALAYASCKELELPTEHVSVYGDDIIVPSEAYMLLTDILTHCGFSVNKEKSFGSGPFRESCGGDFFSGYSCRAFYVKDRFDLRTLVRYRNYLTRTGFRFYLPKTWRIVRNLTKKYEDILGGPDDGTDDHIVLDDVSFSGRKFNFITLTLPDRKLPRRWHSQRVFLLYEIYRREQPIDLCPWDDPSISSRLSDNRKKYKISLSSRY